MGSGNKGSVAGSSGAPQTYEGSGQQAADQQATKEKIDKVNLRLTEEINLRNKRPGRQQTLLTGGSLSPMGSSLPSSNNPLLSIGNKDSGR